MGKISFGRVMSCFSVSSGFDSSWLCIGSVKTHDEMEQKPLITSDLDHLARLKDVPTIESQTLAFQAKPQMVMLRVSMHCNGCARKVEKHISKMEGVTSYKVDLESKMVVVIGDVIPLQVLESVCKSGKARHGGPKPRVKVSRSLYRDLMMVMDDLDAWELLVRLCHATLKRGKLPEEIRRTLGIENDFRPDEEAQALKENAWELE